MASISPVGGVKTVSTAGTGEPLAASSTPVVWLHIQALEGNTNPVYVGDSSVDSSTSKQLALDAEESIIIVLPRGFVTDLANWYVDVTTNGEGVGFLYLA